MLNLSLETLKHYHITKQGKGIAHTSSFKDVLPCHIKGVPLRIGTSREEYQHSIRLLISSEQVERLIEAWVGYDE